MHADLDTLLTTVYCMADDLLPCKPDNARRWAHRRRGRSPSASPRRSWANPEDPTVPRPGAENAASPPLSQAAPASPATASAAARLAAHDRAPGRERSPPSAPAPAMPTSSSSTPRRLECGRSLETTRRSGARAPAAPTATRASHSRHFWGMRLHAVFGARRHAARLGASRPPTSASARWPRALLASATSGGGEAVVGDKGYAGRVRERGRALGATVSPPPRRARGLPRPDPPADRVDLSPKDSERTARTTLNSGGLRCRPPPRHGI